MPSYSASTAALSDLYPVIVPFECLSEGWDGPIRQIGGVHIAQAWAIQGSDRCRHYVTDEQASNWDEAGVDWQAVALSNVRSLSEQGGYGQKEDAAGQVFIKVMLHDDAMGPSRLFVPDLFDADLGPHYQVAIPELTCAVAFRKELSAEQEADIAGIITGCYGAGTTPISPARLPAHELWMG